MKLVMIIQKVDENDLVFGANIPWISSLACQVEHLHVIGLSVGAYHLPDNVTVHSMGKEKGYGRIRRFIRLHSIMLNLYRQKIDGVLVHQGQIYGLVLSCYKLLGVSFILFKAHGSLPDNIRYYLPFFDVVTTTTTDTFPIDTPKKKAVGQGIDVEKFHNMVCPELGRIVTSGRISAIKGYEVFIEAAALLKSRAEAPNLTIDIFGDAYIAADIEYKRSLEDLIARLHLRGNIILCGKIQHGLLPEKISRSELYVDASTGSSALNKGMLEAMACERPVITANEKFASLFGPYADLLMYKCGDPADLAVKIEGYCSLDSTRKEEIGRYMRTVVVRDHNVATLMQKIVTIFAELTKN